MQWLNGGTASQPSLTDFRPIFTFRNCWKRQKTSDFPDPVWEVRKGNTGLKWAERKLPTSNKTAIVRVLLLTNNLWVDHRNIILPVIMHIFSTFIKISVHYLTRYERTRNSMQRCYGEIWKYEEVKADIVNFQKLKWSVIRFFLHVVYRTSILVSRKTWNAQIVQRKQ